MASRQVKLAQDIQSFIRERVEPVEKQLADGERKQEILRHLSNEAREKGLWGNYFPIPFGGTIPSLHQYLPVAEQEGRSEYGPLILGAHLSLDAHMLTEFGNAELHNTFLNPLITGQATPAYAMTDTGKPGSIPQKIVSTAVMQGNQWRIRASKRYISNARCADFFTVVVRTGQANTNREFSMLLVPARQAGVRINQHFTMLDKDLNQGEVQFEDVSIPYHFMLGQQGEGKFLMTYRLRIGRLIRAMHWLGLAQRCYEMMGQRIVSPRGQDCHLMDKQLIRRHVFNSYQSIQSARELVAIAAHAVDALRSAQSGQSITSTMESDTNIKVNTAKVAASMALCRAADKAVQIFGAEGLDGSNPLSDIFRIARTTRIVDGTDEALISATGRALITAFLPTAKQEEQASNHSSCERNALPVI